MLDSTMLMLHGLMDHPVILEMERKRITDAAYRLKLTKMVQRCLENPAIRQAMEIDAELAELFIAAEIAEAKHE